MSGKYYIKTAGTYKLEVKNSSSEAVSVTGTVNFAILTDIGVPFMRSRTIKLVSGCLFRNGIGVLWLFNNTNIYRIEG